MVVLALSSLACGRVGLSLDPNETPSPTNNPSPTPTPALDVYFTSITASETQIGPGQFDIIVHATLVNDSDYLLNDLYVTLSFDDGTNDRTADFEQREPDLREGVMSQPDRFLAAQSSATFDFVVHTTAGLWGPGPISIQGAATFTRNSTTLSAQPSQTPGSFDLIPMNAPIVVAITDDENDGNYGNDTSLREAIMLANSAAGADRIVFDPATFPVATPGRIVLTDALPTIDGSTGIAVIDAQGAGVEIAVDPSLNNSDLYAMTIVAPAVIRGLRFMDVANLHEYQPSISGDNCGDGSQVDGGAIHVQDGSGAIIDGNYFDDSNVLERNCYGALVRFLGGDSHRLLRNEFVQQVMDSVYVNAAGIVEIRDNIMKAHTDNDSSDEGVYIEDLQDNDVWIIGNVIVYQEYSGIATIGNTDQGNVYLLHNTFAHNGIAALNAFRRSNGANRDLYFRNNVFISNNPGAVAIGAGDNSDIAYETIPSSEQYCNPACGSATVDGASFVSPSGTFVADDTGREWSDWTPTAGSVLVDSAADLLDRNGASPGRYQGTGPDRGAIERSD